MIAGGTGISPFLGMLAARARQPEAGDTWLYLGTRTRTEVYGEAKLRDHIAAGALHVRIALSREDRQGCSQEGSLIWSPGPRRRIDALLRDDGEHLWRLLCSQADGGLGGHVYVCGRTGVAASAEQALEEIAARFLTGESQPRRALFRLNGEGRYRREIYTTYPGPHHADARTYDASEVVSHNDPERSCWAIINGRVYDLTRFAQLHPGGDKIIRSYAGMDATAAYRAVGHDTHPEVDALLGLYELGTIRRLDFGSAWGLTVAGSGLQPVTVKAAFRCWITLLFRVVEIENALANDYAIRREPVTHDERSDTVTMSPYKARALFETHRRFRAEHLAGLTGQRFADLWALTSGLDSHHHDASWMQHQLADALSGDVANEVAALERQMIDAFGQIGHETEAASVSRLAWCEAMTAAIEAEDRRVVADLKSALRDGVRFFERDEAEAISTGSAELLASAVALPAIVRTYYGRLAALSASPTGGRVVEGEALEQGLWSRSSAPTRGFPHRRCSG